MPRSRPTARPRRGALALAIVLAASALCRWLLADRVADWGVDEAANVWLASRMAAGPGDGLGLPSSLGIRNLAGAPLLGLPFTLLPDLLSISRALSLVHLVALTFLGFRLARRSGARWPACLILAGMPSLLLSSFSFWNQYLTLPIGAAICGLLLTLLEDGHRGSVRVAAVAGVAALAVLEPTVHLAGFGNLAVNALALGALGSLAGGPSPRFPWLRSGLVRLGAARGIAWIVPTALVSLLVAGAVISLAGALPARRLLKAHDPWGLALAAAQAAIALAFLPALIRLARACRERITLADAIRLAFPSQPIAGAFLLGYGSLLLAVRVALVPSLLLPSGRFDLLIPLAPALMAPLLLLGAAEQPPIALRRAGCAAGLALLVGGSLGAFGPSAGYRERYPYAVPASEMAAAVDFVAAAPGGAADAARRTTDHVMVDYDLAKGREWIAGVAVRPGLAWYHIGVPYDWLFLRRHGLETTRPLPSGPPSQPAWRIGYVAPSSSARAGRAGASPPTVTGRTFDRIEVRDLRAP